MTSTVLSKPRPIEKTRFHARFNWPLIIGVSLVGLVIYLAMIGPEVAPQDPLQENLLVRDERSGEWHIPPFPAFEVTGFPLGSDEFGRDLYSRLLWAIRPTLQMVAIVASVRLVLGTLIGLIAGWSTSRFGRFFDSLISGALALPGLLVALGTIAVVGVELGLIAFVIGLSITGWAETARIVREQTRLIKSQVYIEAANALGASASQIVFRHVVRQIQAMLLMLFAFEISSTLMLTAGLGFLGYYIGGDVWVDVSDFVARRTSGSPELGQMLATAWVRLTDPWGLVSVGSVVFIAVLGFNLIGEGLRLRLNQEVAGGILKWLGERTSGFFLTIEHYITFPIGRFFERPVPFVGLRLILGVIVGATAVWGWDHGWFKLPEADISFLYDDSPNLAPIPDQSTIQVATPTPPTQVISVAEEETPPPTPVEPEVVWTFKTSSIFTGAPVFAPDGTIYATTSDNFVHALAPDGSVKWQLELPARSVKTPALAEDGTIYIADNEGALDAISPAGDIIWRFLPENTRAATFGPTVGPNGNIYYPSGGEGGIIQAVSPDGNGLWRAEGTTFSFYNATQVSLDGRFVFLFSDAFDTSDGGLLPVEYPSKIDRFVAGNDGKLYFRTGHNVVEWQMPDGAPEILQSTAWNYPMNEETLPQETGVTKNQISWELYTAEMGGFTTIFFIEMIEGEEVGTTLGVVGSDVSSGTLIYLDEDTLFTVICGFGNFRFPNTDSPKPQCDGMLPEEEPAWHFRLDKTANFVGAAYQPETEIVYITTQEGDLYAVDTSPVQELSGTTAFEFPTTPVEITKPVAAWEYKPDGGFAGKPVTGADGTIYVAEKGGKVTALAQYGTIIWETALEPAPGEGLTLSPNGTLYVPDVSGGLAAFDGQGTLLWQFIQPVSGLSPASAPIITTDGRVYYTVTDQSVGYIQAVSTSGEGVWLSEPSTATNFYKNPEVYTTGELVFLAENVFDALTGSSVILTPPADSLINPESFITGENGKNYFREGNTLYEWQNNNNQIQILTTITWQFRAENADNPTVSISVPQKIRIDPSGNITLWYRYNVVWLTETGESLGQALTTPSTDQTISSVVYAQDDTTLTCGITLSATEPSSELCMGFQLGEEKPLWKISFGSSSLIGEKLLGGERTPSGFVFASVKGILYGVMEESIAQAWETAKNQPTVEPEESVPTTGSEQGWNFNAPEPLLSLPLLGPDGTAYFMGDSQTMYILAPNGSLQASFALPNPMYVQENSTFGGGVTRFTWMPEVMEDGGILVVSADKVYALNPDGSSRWEFPLENEPYTFPTLNPTSGEWVMTDRLATFYAFSSSDGLKWTHDLEEGLKSAAPWPVFGPNGEIYYTITTGGSAKIEALNPDGTSLWRTDLTTFSFYNPIQITYDGNWVIIDDNLVNAGSGRLVETDNLEFEVTALTVGYDGKNYLISGSTVMEWVVGANGLRVENQATLAFPDNFQRGIAPQLSVSKDSIYWIRLFSGFGRRQINLWGNADGEILSNVTIDTVDEHILQVDDENGLLAVCSSNADDTGLECRGYDGKSNNPAWQVNLEGIGDFEDYFYSNGRLYIQVDDDTVRMVEVDLPLQ